MGPKIQSVERQSQATPYSNDFLKLLQGHLSGAFQGPTGTAGMTPGQSPQQMVNFQQKLGGINTASQYQDNSNQLMGALTARSNATTDRSAAALREGQGVLGSRFGSSAARGEGLLRSEAGLNLDQLLASVMFENAARQQQARQFDVQANLEAAAPFFQMAGLGIIPNEIIASPGVGQQILGGALDLGAAYLTGGGSLFGKAFGGGGGGMGGAPAGGGSLMPGFNPGIMPQFGGNRRPDIGGGSQGALPNFGNDPFYNPQFGRRY